MGGFFSMEQNVRNNVQGAKAPRLNARNSPNVEAGPNTTRRNNAGARNNSRRNGNNVAVNMGSVGTSDPEELEEVVVNSRPNSPANTRINVNRRNNNGRINVQVNNSEENLPNNNTPEGEEQVGGKRRRKSRKGRKSRRSSRKNHK